MSLPGISVLLWGLLSGHAHTLDQETAYAQKIPLSNTLMAAVASCLNMFTWACAEMMRIRDNTNSIHICHCLSFSSQPLSISLATDSASHFHCSKGFSRRGQGAREPNADTLLAHQRLLHSALSPRPGQHAWNSCDKQALCMPCLLSWLQSTHLARPGHGSCARQHVLQRLGLVRNLLQRASSLRGCSLPGSGTSCCTAPTGQRHTHLCSPSSPEQFQLAALTHCTSSSFKTSKGIPQGWPRS